VCVPESCRCVCPRRDCGRYGTVVGAREGRDARARDTLEDRPPHEGPSQHDRPDVRPDETRTKMALTPQRPLFGEENREEKHSKNANGILETKYASRAPGRARVRAGAGARPRVTCGLSRPYPYNT
jgi:hypothetical protein